MSLNKQISISEVVSAILKHRFKAALTFVLVMALIAAVFLVWPRKYGSEGRLYVQLGRTGTGLDPTAGHSSISIQDSRETEIRSVVELVKSRAIIESVVNSIGPEEILKDPIRDSIKLDISLPAMTWNGHDESGALSRAEFKRLQQFEVACERLENSLTVHAEKKTSVISIYCLANSPQLAQRLVQQVMLETQAKNLDVHSVKGSSQFFEKSFEQKQAALVAAENRLGAFKNRNDFLSITGAIGTQQQVIDKLAVELIDAEVNLAQAQSRLDNIQEQMAAIQPTVLVPTSGVEKLSAEDSRTELFKLESELKRLEKTLNANHPKWAPLQSSVESLRQELNQRPDERTQSVSLVNPVYEKVKVLQVTALANLKAAQSRQEHLLARKADARARLEELNHHEIAASQLSRDLDIARQEMELYSRKRAESAVIDALDQNRISDVVVAQEATFVVRHHSPRGSLIFPLGVVLAGLCATGTALYFERDLLSGHLSEEEVERILEVPILVSLPRVAAHRNMVS